MRNVSDKNCKTAKSVEGKKTHWNVATLQMSVKFDAEITICKKFKKLLLVGYDNEGYRADNEAYETYLLL